METNLRLHAAELLLARHTAIEIPSGKISENFFDIVIKREKKRHEKIAKLRGTLTKAEKFYYGGRKNFSKRVVIHNDYIFRNIDANEFPCFSCITGITIMITTFLKLFLDQNRSKARALAIARELIMQGHLDVNGTQLQIPYNEKYEYIINHAGVAAIWVTRSEEGILVINDCPAELVCSGTIIVFGF